MRYGVALQPFVDGTTDDALRALDEFAARSALPHIVPIWCREWKADARLFAGIRERGVEPVAFIEATTPVIPVDDLLRFADAVGDAAVRPNQEMDGHWGAGWQDWTPRTFVSWWVGCRAVLPPAIRLWWCPSQPGKAQRAGYWPGPENVDIIGFDRYRWDSGDTIDDWDASIRACQRLAPGKPIWVGETGALVGTPARAKWLRSLSQVEADVVVVMNLLAERPDGKADDWRFDERMDETFAMLTGGT